MKKHKYYMKTLIITLTCLLTTYIQSVESQNIQTVKKELIAIRTEHPPTVDGVLNDTCWQDVPQATGFTDERTEKPAKNQTVGRLVYTDKAIYVGIHLYDDMPDKIVARQTKDQTRFQGEDWISFSIDTFHTHQFSDRSFFIVNPLGTKFAHLATGRAEKSEWIGLWKAAAQIVEDGWIVEMEIPWQMLDYPDTKKLIRMGINIDRGQQRIGEKSWWCNLGVNEFRENDGHWIDVLPPRRKRELSFLPYLIGGITETETIEGDRKQSQREYTARAGGDIRYEVTPQMRLIGTANPDFDNIEQDVEGIDFSYGERYVFDRRPFFAEGGNAYYLDSFFHSRRIADMDGGLKLFGKVAKNTTVSTLGTYHRNNQNFILRVAQGVTATSNINGAFLSHHQRVPDMNSDMDTDAHSEANNIGYFWGNMRHRKLSGFAHIAQGWAEDSDGRDGFARLGYEGHYIQTSISGYFIDPDFVNRLGFHPFTGFRGVNLTGSLNNEWRSGYIRRAYLTSYISASNTYEGDIFRRNLYVSTGILTHSDFLLSAQWDGGNFEEYTDSVFTVGLGIRATDRFNNFGIQYAGGKQSDKRIHRIGSNLNLRANGFTARLLSIVQWHFERQYQQILTLTYDFTPALSLGSRLIWQAEKVNVYFALRRSGYAGMDFFIILGDPNALEFRQLLVAKVIRAF